MTNLEANIDRAHLIGELVTMLTRGALLYQRQRGDLSDALGDINESISDLVDELEAEQYDAEGRFVA